MSKLSFLYIFTFSISCFLYFNLCLTFKFDALLYDCGGFKPDNLY